MRKHAICGILLLVGSIALALPAYGVAAPRAIGDTRVLARVPSPGQPAGIAVDRGKVWTSTLGFLAHPVTDPAVLGFKATTGVLRRTISVPRSMPVSAMALFGLAFDAHNRLYAVDMNGMIIRIDPKTAEHETYATFTPSSAGLSAMPYDLAFDDAGNAYVTDQNLAGIWIVPPGGGTARMWFQDPRLTGYFFGPTGIALDSESTHLYFTVASSQHPATNFPDSTEVTLRQGLVFRLPVADPRPENLELLYSYPAGSSPFGLALGASGKLYVALSGANQISILQPNDTGEMPFREEMRFPSAEENSKQEVPFDKPIGVALSSRGSLFVTNSSFLANDAEHMAIFDIYVGDDPARLVRPDIP